MAESCHSTRRAFLRSAAAATALPIAGCTEIAMAQAEELPVTKVNRIARELSLALNEYDEGRWHAEIHPSGKRDFPIGFKVSDLHIPPAIALKNQIALTKEAMSNAYPDRDINCYSTLEETGGHATLIFVTTT